MPLRTLIAVLVLLSTASTTAWSQTRSSIELDTRTSRSVMVEQLDRGSIVPVPITPTPPPTAPVAAAPTSPGMAQETSLLLPVRFGFDSAQLSPQARSILDVMAEAMNDPILQHRRFLLEGHTDATGGWEYNAGLSQRRANAVARYLIQRGVRSDRLLVVGYSWNRLLPGLSPYDARHRRVEIGRLQ